MRPILTREQLQQHQSYLSQMDVIYEPLYDFQSYAVAGQTNLSFFSAPQGQGVTSSPNATGAKTIADTNMETANQLGKGNQFYATGIEVLFFPGIDPGRAAVAEADLGEFVDDVWVVSKSGVLTLQVGSGRTYVQQGPLGLFPPSARLAVQSAVTGAGATATTFGEINYAVFSGEVYTIVPLLLDSNQTFSVNLTWPAAVALPSASIGRIGVRLRGYRIRNAQ